MLFRSLGWLTSLSLRACLDNNHGVQPLFGEELAACAAAVGIAGESEDFGVVDEAVGHGRWKNFRL